jgi:hypothetical protein
VQPPVIVYDKSDNPIPGSCPRPNVGREAETILHHIVTHYAALPDITLFLQGDPRFNPITYTYDQIVERLNSELPRELVPFLAPTHVSENIHEYWCKSAGALFTCLFDSATVSVAYAAGAEYIVPRACILSRPIELYAALLASVVKFGNRPVDPDADNFREIGVSAYALEPIFGAIFNPQTALRPDWHNCFTA